MAAAATQRAKTPAAKNPALEKSVAMTPDHEEVARLAYSYWEARGSQGGSAEEDWYRAEAELMTGDRTAGAGMDGA